VTLIFKDVIRFSIRFSKFLDWTPKQQKTSRNILQDFIRYYKTQQQSRQAYTSHVNFCHVIPVENHVFAHVPLEIISQYNVYSRLVESVTLCMSHRAVKREFTRSLAAFRCHATFLKSTQQPNR